MKRRRPRIRSDMSILNQKGGHQYNSAPERDNLRAAVSPDVLLCAQQRNSGSPLVYRAFDIPSSTRALLLYTGTPKYLYEDLSMSKRTCISTKGVDIVASPFNGFSFQVKVWAQRPSESHVVLFSNEKRRRIEACILRKSNASSSRYSSPPFPRSSLRSLRPVWPARISQMPVFTLGALSHLRLLVPGMTAAPPSASTAHSMSTLECHQPQTPIP